MKLFVLSKQVTARHSALDAESPNGNHLSLWGLRVMLRQAQQPSPQ